MVALSCANIMLEKPAPCGPAVEEAGTNITTAHTDNDVRRSEDLAVLEDALDAVAGRLENLHRVSESRHVSLTNIDALLAHKLLHGLDELVLVLHAAIAGLAASTSAQLTESRVAPGHVKDGVLRRRLLDLGARAIQLAHQMQASLPWHVMQD